MALNFWKFPGAMTMSDTALLRLEGGGTLACEDVAALEQAYVRLPLEQVRRAFRSQHRIVEKDLGQLAPLIRGIDPADVEKRGRAAARLRGLAERMRAADADSERHLGCMIGRLDELQALSAEEEEGGDGVLAAQWQRQHMYRGVAEFLLQCGVSDGAHALADHAGVRGQIDGELYDELRRVRGALEGGHAAECLAWCSENRASLRRGDSPLEFMLRRQEFVELARRRALAEAVAYAQKHFPAFAQSNALEVEQALALLAVSPATATYPYSWLYDPARWRDIALHFEAEMRALHALPEQSQLVSVLHAGLAALKTPKCASGSALSCPVCVGPLARVSRDLPHAHHDTSVLVCPVTGMVMDADNPPMVLPSGVVYSSAAVRALSSANNGRVPCTRTSAVYTVHELRKCYIS